MSVNVKRKWKQSNKNYYYCCSSLLLKILQTTRLIESLPPKNAYSPVAEHFSIEANTQQDPFFSRIMYFYSQSIKKNTSISFYFIAYIVCTLVQHRESKNELCMYVRTICINDVCRRDNSILPDIDFFLYEAGLSYTDL